MQVQTRETFFLPDEYSSTESRMDAECYNRVRNLLGRSASGHVFIPIRSMQYLAILDGHDIWFIDSQAYAARDNQGGRMITISWHCSRNQPSLQDSSGMRVVFYRPGLADVQLRLVCEFRKALQRTDQRLRDDHAAGDGAMILPFQR